MEPHTGPPAILSVKDLRVEFLHEGKIIPAVDRISFELKKGGSLGIVGESGSGKSVTSLSIMRLIPAPPGQIAGGEIWYHEPEKSINLLELPEKTMRSWRGKKISMIFQEPMTSLNPAYRCGKQVMESILQHEPVTGKQARSRVLELFREVQLPAPEEIFLSYPHQLSGGQKQRVMIAMALACNPDILIADEPTTALDVTVQKAILQLLKQLQEKHGMSLVFISHDLGVIAEIAADVIVMHQGKIVEQGNVSDIFRKPAHPYTRGLIACRPPLGIRPDRLPVVSDYLEGKPVNPVLVSREERERSHRQLFSAKPLLKVENLQTTFSGKGSLFRKSHTPVRAVDNVSFEVFRGETLGLVGESGSGKTTLGRTLLRLIEPSAGSIVYNDTDLGKLMTGELRKMRKKMQIIFQDPYSSLNPRLIAGFSVMEPMKVHKLHGTDSSRKARAVELLKSVGLDESHFYRYPHEFSGGQRQRVCIARALAVEPEFIICDESVSALDVSVQAQVLNLLNDLKKKFNLTYIFISHDLSVVRYMSDRMIVMKDGRIRETGEADQVYEHPQSAYTKQLIEAIPKGTVIE